MRIGNRLFPYPVLNKNFEQSGYTEGCSFSFVFETSAEGTVIVEKENVCFKQLHYDLTDNALQLLVEEGKAECLFIVECSAAVYRKAFPITSVPTDLNVYIKDLKGLVVVSAYIYAKEAIHQYSSENFNGIYSGYSFDLDKFCILAADDGCKFNVDTDTSIDNKVASIFTIVSKEIDSCPMDYSDDGKKITIVLPKTHYESYDKIKRKPEYNNIAFAMIAIPVLAMCIAEIKNQNYESIEDIVEQKSWFNAVCISYKRVLDKELTIEDLNSLKALYLAQLVLNNSSCNGISDFENLLTRGKDGGESDE